MLIGAGIGALFGAGFSIGKEIYNSGWDLGRWDWKNIGLSILGGAVAGVILSITIAGSGLLSYLFTFFSGW